MADMWFRGNELLREVSTNLSSRTTRPQACKTNTSRIVDVEGVVEYKSLPSGLHNVTEDLV